MANLFEGLTQETTPFEGLAQTVDTPVPAKSVDRVAQMAAIALDDTGKLPDIVAKSEEYAQEISRTGNSDSLRERINARTQQRRLESLGSLVHHGSYEDSQGAQLALQEAILEDKARQKKSEMERVAAENMVAYAAAGNTVKAWNAGDVINNGGVMDVMADTLAKQQILANVVENAQIDADSQDLLGKATGWVLSMFPIYDSAGQLDNVEIDKGMKSFGDFLFSGRVNQAQSNKLYTGYPIDEFPDIVKQVSERISQHSTFMGFQDKAKEARLWGQLATPDAMGYGMDNLWNAMANMDLIAGGAGLGAKSLISGLAKVGGRRVLADAVASAAFKAGVEGSEDAAKAVGMNVNEVAQHILPAAVNLAPTNEAIPVAGLAIRKAALAEELTKELASTTQPGRLIDDELDIAQKRAEEKVRQRLGNQEINDFKRVEVVGVDGTKTYALEVNLGEFPDEETALRFAKDYSISPDQIVKDEGAGTVAIKFRSDIAEDGMYTTPFQPQSKNLLSRLLLSSNITADKVTASMGQVIGNTKARMSRIVYENYAKNINSVTGKVKERVAPLLDQSNIESRWLEEDEFAVAYKALSKGESHPPEAWMAYQKTRELNDFAWHLDNFQAYKTKILRGLEAVSFEGPGGRVVGKKANGKVSYKWEIDQHTRVMNISDNVLQNKNRKFTTQEIQRMKDEGYVLVSLEKEIVNAQGEHVSAILARPKDLVIEPLAAEQVPYKAGGRRYYADGQSFAKQAHITTDADGSKILRNPRTFIAGTKAEVDDWVRRVNEAIAMYKANPKISEGELNQVLPSSYHAENFIAHVEAKEIDINHPIRQVYDREELPEYRTHYGAGNSFFDDTETSVESLRRTNGHFNRRQRGKEVLTDWENQGVLRLNPWESANRALHHVTNMASNSDYKISQIERWYQTYRDSLINGANMSPTQAFQAGKFADVRQEIVQAGETQRGVIRRTLGWKTEFDVQQDELGRRMQEFIMGDDPHSLRHSVGRDLVKWYDNNSPVDAIRGLATDLKLGLFNPGQFVLQVSTAMTAMFTAGTIKPMFALYPLRSFLAKNGTEHTLNQWIKSGAHTSLGMEPEEFKTFMHSAKNSGFFDVAFSHTYLANDSSAFDRQSFIRNGGRFFLTQAELVNRSVGWSIAWDALKKEGRKDFTSQAFQRDLAREAEKWSWNMSQNSGAAWQKGFMSVPTQFWAYPARMLEMMLGPQTTKAQKIRLILSQMFLFGSAGVPGASYVSEQLKKRQVDNPDWKPASIDTFGGAIDRGMLDTMIYNITGADVQVGSRMGTGNWVTDLPVVTDVLQTFFGASGFGPKSFPEIVFGASGTIATAGMKTFWDLTKMVVAESGGDTGYHLSQETFQDVIENISTASNLFKAYSVANYGTWMTTKGRTMTNDVPESAWWAAALGFAPGQVAEMNTQYLFKKDRDKVVNEAVTIANNYRTRYVNEIDNRDKIAGSYSTYMSMLTPDIRADVQKRLRGRVDPSMADTLARQIQRERETIAGNPEDASN